MPDANFLAPVFATAPVSLPILAGQKRLGSVVEAARKKFGLCGEITLEANPFVLPQSEYEGLVEAGFNRISFGLQSAIPGELKALGRAHSPEQAANAVRQAKRAGFLNISVDIMLGIPGQSPESLKQTLDFIGGLDLQHVSAYLLNIEQGTPFDRMQVLKDCPDDDLSLIHISADFSTTVAASRKKETQNAVMLNNEVCRVRKSSRTRRRSTTIPPLLSCRYRLRSSCVCFHCSFNKH